MTKRLLIALMLLAGCTGECIEAGDCRSMCVPYGAHALTKESGCVCNTATEVHCTGGTAK